MKKILILFCTFCGLISNAQTFFYPSDMNVTFTQTSQASYWQSNFVTPTWSYNYIDGKGVMCATWLIQGKFATLYFSEDKTDLGVCAPNGITQMDNLNENVSSQLGYSTGNIEFDKIVYNPNTKAIYIPYGTISNFMGTYYNILLISLYDSLNSYTSPIFEDNTTKEEKFYNINGQKIDPKTADDKIIIKTDGVSAQKILNKR